MPQPLQPLQPLSSDARHVFVYGTLRRGEQRDINRLHPTPVWVGEGSVSGSLYDLGSYPGLVTAGGAGRVRGEVYIVSDVLERLLDEIEEVWPQQTGEYAKIELAVLLDQVPGATRGEAGVESHILMPCLAYEIAVARVQGMPTILQGDWVAYRLVTKS